ncbi:hypothetical protein [Pectinatus brassicae]|uniref:Uncharacterized protein n=1 Tax=Pectinatus brassicae TaxID=862415 RepID=A0A840UTJ4_9FIRM|nr:hypothetical protein [Pectinatus brassicae]MBB5336283.1 hypothetical protein [Pectinatus brassicae]
MLKKLDEKIYLAGKYNGMEAIDGWSLPTISRGEKGEYTDSTGKELYGIFKQNIRGKNTNYFIINKGNIIYDCELPTDIDNISIDSPLISWKNLCYHTPTVLPDKNNNPLGANYTALLAIIEERKPCSVFVVDSDIQLANSINLMKKFAIEYRVHRNYKDITSYYVKAARKGFIHEYVDFNRYISILYKCAESAGFNLFEEIDITLIYVMLDKEIIEIMELFELMNESYPELVVVTGLCLGFPPQAVLGYLTKGSTRVRFKNKCK